MQNLTSPQNFFKPSAEPPAFWVSGYWCYRGEVGKWAGRGRQGPPPQFRFNDRSAWVRTCDGKIVTFRNIEAPPAAPESAGDDPAPLICGPSDRELIRRRPRTTEGPPKRNQRPRNRALRSAAEAAGCRFSNATLPNIDRNGPPGKRVVKSPGLPPRGLPKNLLFRRAQAAARSSDQFAFVRRGEAPAALPSFHQGGH
jgi:hypothetical protein